MVLIKLFKTTNLSIGLSIIFVFVTLQWWQPNWLSRLEGIGYDFKLVNVMPPVPKSEVNIQIVDIDEPSIAQLGRWPWPRAQLANLLAELKQQGALVVAFDMLFSEPQRNMAQQVLSKIPEINNLKSDSEQLNSLIQQFDNDLLFAQQMSDIDVVLGILFQQDSKLHKGQILAPAIIQPDGGANNLHRFKGFNASIDVLNQAALGQGFINAVFDKDGFIRRVALLVDYDSQLYASLALEAFRVYSFAEQIEPQWVTTEQARLHGIKVGKEYVATDQRGQLLLPFRGPARSYPYTSAAEVISNTISDNRFDGAVVFVGTSSVGIADLRSTPMSIVYPGVEIHATAFDALTQPKNIPVQPDWWLGANISLMILLGSLLLWLFRNSSPLVMTMGAGFMIIGIWLFNLALWYFYLVHLPHMSMLLMLLTLAAFMIAQGFFKENKRRQQVKAAFDQYVPPAHIEKLLNEDENVSLAGERKELTVLFADIRNFTEHSEKLAANELKQMLNDYFSPITKIIFQQQGTIDKYVGDMVMAFWGAPLADENHAIHALDAAMEMLVCTKQLANEFKQQSWPELNIGIGLNTGQMNVGDMGSSYRRSYTVIGDAVNLASRLESLTKFYGVEILVAEHTKLQCPDYEFMAVDRVKVKGKK